MTCATNVSKKKQLGSWEPHSLIDYVVLNYQDMQMRLLFSVIGRHSGQLANSGMSFVWRTVQLHLRGVGSRIASIGDGRIKCRSRQCPFSKIFIIFDCPSGLDVEAESAALVRLTMHPDLAVLEISELSRDEQTEPASYNSISLMLHTNSDCCTNLHIAYRSWGWPARSG